MYIAAYGWDHDSWQGSFYPDDLPKAWRLGYYANEFAAVVVPSGGWIDLEPAQAESWQEDTPEGFRFFLELPEGPARNGDELAEAAGSLDGRIGGFVGVAESEGFDALALRLGRLAPVCGLAARLREADYDICSSDPQGVACRGPGRLAVGRSSAQAGPAELRNALEALAATGSAASLLWFGGTLQAITAMRQGTVVAELLGLC